MQEVTSEHGGACAQLCRDVVYDYVAGEIRGELRLGDMANALAGVPRYNNWTPIVWSLAAHECFVAEILAAIPEMPLVAVFGGLHHDDHEVLVGDVMQPFKMAMSKEMRSEYTYHANRAQGAIVRALGISRLVPSPSDPANAAIKSADIAALEAERLWLFPFRRTWGTEKIVDPRMLEIAQRILRGDFHKIANGVLAAERYIKHHNALIQRMGVS